jgi:ABC-type phosphate transport system substrate-binding protein
MRRLCVAALTVTLLSPAASRAGDVALIVHPTNPVAGLTWTEVVAIFKAEQQHWKAGERIYLILQESGTPERALLLRRVYRMSDVELKQFWLAKLFRGEIPAFPRVVASSAAAKRIVAQAPNALAFIDAAAVDSTVKALRIDGQKAGEPGYALAVPPP